MPWDYPQTGGSGGGNPFNTEVSAPDYKATGLTGAANVSRYVGATTGGAPASGTFQVGDMIVDRTGSLWVCTVAGSPGTWAQVGGSHGAEYNYSFSLANGSEVPPTGAVWTSITDTDNFGTSLAASGTFTIPAGQGGRYTLSGQLTLPPIAAQAYLVVIVAFTGLPSHVTETNNPETRLQPTFATNTQQSVNVGWTGKLAGGATPALAILQNNGGAGAVTATGYYSITRISSDGT